MPGYILNFQEKETSENVRFSSYLTMKIFSKTSIVLIQYNSISNEHCIKHDTVIKPVYLKNMNRGYLFEIFPMNLIKNTRRA